jgi:RNA polymerase sigma-70 factor (ECF subfamily)
MVSPHRVCQTARQRGSIVNTMLAASDLPWPELDGNLRAFIARRVHNQSDVDDLVQRVLLQIVKGLGSLRDAGRLHAWVYRTARNVIVDYYRAAGSRREYAAGDALDLEAAEAAELAPLDDDGAALRELASCLAPMLSQLSPAYQEAIRMVDLEGTPQQEAAERAGVSVSGMKSRVQRGRQQRRDVLEACCRIDLDRRGGVAAYAARHPSACGCGGCVDR